MRSYTSNKEKRRQLKCTSTTIFLSIKSRNLLSQIAINADTSVVGRKLVQRKNNHLYSTLGRVTKKALNYDFSRFQKKLAPEEDMFDYVYILF